METDLIYGGNEGMGASGWSYFTKYQSDIKNALQDLRWEVFNKKEYQAPQILITESWEEYKSRLPPDLTQEDLVSFKEEFDYLSRLAKTEATSPDVLLNKCYTEGTHSIIDILDITDDPSPTQSGPLPKAKLIEIFGTEKPTHEMLKKKEMEIQTYRGRWLCTYIIVFKDNKPNEIFFTGYSGD